jgi:RNA polymerase sigma-B factor
MPELPVGSPAADGLVEAQRHQLILENLGLAKYLARRFAERGEPLEDLQQTASLALVAAANRFDPSHGATFSTFAAQTIIGELKHHFRDHGWAVRAPRQLQELYLEVTAAMGDLTISLGRNPTTSELASACGRSEQEVAAAITAGHAYRASSLDAPDGTLDALCERWVDDEGIEGMERRAELASHLSALPPRDQEILRLRFVDERSQAEIADVLDLSPMQISRLLRRALDALRTAYAGGV